MEARIADPVKPSPTGALLAPRTGAAKWAVENPMAFSGLWFAAAAGLLVGQALIFLPALVAEARAIGGPAAWQWGAFALAYAYLAPLLLALILGSLLGGPIVVPGFSDGWAPAARGMLVGVGSLVVWLLIGTLALRSMSGTYLAGGSDAPPGAAEAVGLVLLPVPFLMVAAVGGIAGFLLHALVPQGSNKTIADGRQAKEVHSGGAE